MKKLVWFSCVVAFAVLLLSVLPESAAGDKEFRKLRRNLIRAVSTKDSDKIGEALVEIIVHGGADAVNAIVNIVERIPASESVVYWRLVKGACMVTDREAMEELAKVIVKHRRDALGRDLLFALQNNRCSNVAIVHQAVLERCQYDMQKLSVESLVNMEEDAAIDALIAGLKKAKDSAIRDEIVSALRALTSADCGDTAEDWARAREQGLLGISKKGKKGASKGSTGTVVDDLERYRREQMFGGEGRKVKLKALVITDICDPEDKKMQAVGDAICFDHIEYVLQRMKVETTVILRKDFSKPNYKIPDDILGVFVNCVQIHQHCICPFCRPSDQKRDRLYP